MFKYAGNQEGKRWWTGYYVPKQEFPDKDASEEVKKAMREKRHQDIDEYMEKEEEMRKIYPCYKHLFISAPSFYPPHALSYDARNTSLVVTIQTLHMLAIYTAVPMDAVSNQLDGTLYYITWSDWRGDFLVMSPSGAESATAKRVLHLFNDIAYAVGDHDLKGLQELMPTVNELIAHYRTLLHPDVIVDEKMNLDL